MFKQSEHQVTDPRYIQLQDRIEPHRQRLISHPVYEELNTLDDLRVFMELHIYAVWDFMSLVKALQRHVCCLDTPWLPPTDPTACRFVNEIVLGEESDVGHAGGHASHFELYTDAMRHCGARTAGIATMIQGLQHGDSIADVLRLSEVPRPAREFVKHTFLVIDRADPCELAAAFTFGREDILPDVFTKIVSMLNANHGGQLDLFEYYLQRHIELDGDEHGPMAARLVQTLCGQDEGRWQTAELAAQYALQSRERLWDGIVEEIRTRRDRLPNTLTPEDELVRAQLAESASLPLATSPAI